MTINSLPIETIKYYAQQYANTLKYHRQHQKVYQKTDVGRKNSQKRSSTYYFRKNNISFHTDCHATEPQTHWKQQLSDSTYGNLCMSLKYTSLLLYSKYPAIWLLLLFSGYLILAIFNDQLGFGKLLIRAIFNDQLMSLWQIVD